MKHISIQVTRTERVEFEFKSLQNGFQDMVEFRVGEGIQKRSFFFDGTWTPQLKTVLGELDTPELRAAIEAEWHANRTLADDELRRTDGAVVRMTDARLDADGDLLVFLSGEPYCPEFEGTALLGTRWQSGTAERASAWGREFLRKQGASVTTYPRPDAGPRAWVRAFRGSRAKRLMNHWADAIEAGRIL